jgi:hypothetical protein
MTDLDTGARQIREAFDHDLASYHAPADLARRARRGGLRRGRRRQLSVAASLTAVAGAAAATVAALLPAATAQAAAWTVASRPNGEVVVTVHELRDPAGLQHRLRQDGVPASVIFGGKANPACDLNGPGQYRQIFLTQRHLGRSVAVVIRPGAIPDGGGILLGVVHVKPKGTGPTENALALGLVKTSPECTGT